MKTITSGFEVQKVAEQAAWAEVYDIYLSSAIVTPWGTVSTLRLTPCPSGVQFFTPLTDPEPAGTRGDAQGYTFWNMVRKAVKSSSRTANDKLMIAASNVSRDWSGMLAAVDWYDTWVVIRKVPLTFAGTIAAGDCVVVFMGQVDTARIQEKQIQLTCSNDMGSFSKLLPAESMHATCRFKWGDDMCTQIRYRPENYAGKTAAAGGTVYAVRSDDLTEDTGAAGYIGQAVTADATGNKIGLAAHGLENGRMVRFGGTAVPGGLTAGVWYYVVGTALNDFQVSLTAGGSAVDLTSAGTAVVMDSAAPYGTDLLAALADAAITQSNGNYVGWEGFRVKAGYEENDFWAMHDYEWGTCAEGYWWNNTAGWGLHSHLCTPWITMDFGTNRTLRLWRLRASTGADRTQMPRLLMMFSSADNFVNSVKFEGFWEMPALAPGAMWEWLLPKAATARYWRIGVRSQWADSSVTLRMLGKVSAYEGGRNWWTAGRLTFGAATATAALRGVSRKVQGSHAGVALVTDLPVAPAAGDTFVIERGCNRTFNACAERGNFENYGGFDSMPFQAVAR
jgi:hypothetical protein